MELYTIQMAQWRMAKARGISFLDTTVKSGEPWIAPDWNMVMDIKAKKITEEQYTKLYTDRMVASYYQHTDLWHALIKNEKLAIACYCAPGTFCHRHILVKLIQGLCLKQNTPFTYMGELTI